MRVLVTNDDGVAAPGIHHLASALAAAGHDLVVAAPQVDMSGSGAALGRLHVDEHIDVETCELPGLVGVPTFGVLGPPALAVLAARLGGFGAPPELVVSGINPGANTGRATLHSGTVGAALTASNFGVSGLAVSLVPGDPMHWETATAVAVCALDWLGRAPARTVLNLNVPDLPLDALRGVRRAALAPFGTVRAAIAQADLPVGRAGVTGRLQMELRDTGERLPDDSDTALVLAGFVAVTELVGLRAAEPATTPTDLVDHLDRAVGEAAA
ncbi:MAG: 5'/3'-nucleotidase SurE [Acidimicrobiales bacterium]|nr:5'/3'-nucleotidase SurE [Acidimicrobiales bacterium]